METLFSCLPIFSAIWIPWLFNMYKYASIYARLIDSIYQSHKKPNGRNGVFGYSSAELEFHGEPPDQGRSILQRIPVENRLRPKMHPFPLRKPLRIYKLLVISIDKWINKSLQWGKILCDGDTLCACILLSGIFRQNAKRKTRSVQPHKDAF